MGREVVRIKRGMYIGRRWSEDKAENVVRGRVKIKQGMLVRGGVRIKQCLLVRGGVRIKQRMW